MAGLAAALNVPDAVDALAAALASRGADAAVCRLDGGDGALLEVGVRAVLPSIARVVGEPDTTVVAAIAVDGVASISALDAGYAADGPTGLLDGTEPYAVVLADAEREALVLARHGDAPGLYYARHGDGWLAASEPTALIQAGVDPRPDPDTVAHFITTGAADDTAHTFFADVSRVRADEVVTLAADGEVQSIRADRPRPAPSVPGSLWDSVARGRVAVLLRPGPIGAAVLGAALARPDRPRPLPVHTVTFPALDPAASGPPAVLVPLPNGAVRHHTHAFDPTTLDLDLFLREVGEPVPDLDLYLLWSVARDLGGTADVLVDAARGRPETVSRISDRLLARYGVAIRCPLRESGAGAGDDDLAALVSRTLAPEIARYAARDPAGPVTAAQILLRLRDEVAAALAVPRPWVEPGVAVDALRRLAAGEPVDADAVLRTYLVERWLRALAPVVPVPVGSQGRESGGRGGSGSAGMDGRGSGSAGRGPDPEGSEGRGSGSAGRRSGSAGSGSGGAGSGSAGSDGVRSGRARSGSAGSGSAGSGSAGSGSAGSGSAGSGGAGSAPWSGSFLAESTMDESIVDSEPELTEAIVDGARWLRWPVRTKLFGGGTEFARTTAWYAGNALADLRQERSYREALRGPWFAVLSGKALAVTQRRISPLWKIAPGRASRVLARLARRRLPRLAEPWTMQVALEEGGLVRVGAAVLSSYVGAVDRAWRLLPDRAIVSAPRSDAVPPADGAVVRPPAEADVAARSLLDALRYSLPPDLVQTLAGCAVVSADDVGVRLLGYADGPYADAVPHAIDVLLTVCEDNPTGQGRERTPLLLVFEAPAPHRREPAVRVAASSS